MHQDWPGGRDNLTLRPGWLDYGDDGDSTDKYRSRIVSLNPYLSWTSEAGLRLWGTAGYGRGEIGFDGEWVGERLSTAGVATVVAGASGTLFEDDELIEGGTTRLDRVRARWHGFFVEGGGDLSEALAVSLQHLRLVFEGSDSQ